MQPFVALMRRYVLDYTNRHDVSVCQQIMSPDYTLTMGEHVLTGRDEHYIPAANTQFAQFPGLCLTVHHIITNGAQLAMHFSEHGASIRHQGKPAAWEGIGLYRWDGTWLLDNYVEQDYLSRRRQLATGAPHPVRTPAIAPWDTTAEATNPQAQATVQTWIESGLSGSQISHDDGTAVPCLDNSTAETDIMFSAGNWVAFRLTQHGQYIGGLHDIDQAAHGRDVTLHSIGLVHASGGQVHGHIINNRLDLVRRLRSNNHTHS